MICRAVVRSAPPLAALLLLSGCLIGGDSSDKQTISLTITSPSPQLSLETSDSKVRIAGTASSNVPIVEVSWSNNRGGQGIATGSEAWQTGAIVLKLGDNLVTIVAEDLAGATTSKTVLIHRESGQTGSTTLAWTAPTARVDGSPLTNLAGYKIFYGRMAGIYDYQIEIDNPGVVTYVVENLVSGDWYFSLAAFDGDGIESNRSNEVLRKII